MAQTFETIVAQLSEHESGLLKQQQELHQKLKGVTDQLDQIRLAIKALRGNQQRTTAVPVCSTKKKLDDATLAGLIAKHTTTSGSLSHSKLTEAIQTDLVALGYPRYGLKVRIAKCLPGHEANS